MLYASLAAVYLIWGSTYLAMRVVALAGMPVFLAASLRFFVAGSVLLGVALARGVKFPSASDLKRSAPPGVLLFLGGSGFASLATSSIHSSSVAMVCATMPLWAGAFGTFFGARPTKREWASLAVGFLGVFLLLNSPTLSGRPIHVVVLICSPISWSLGSLLARRNKDIEHGAALQLMCGGVALLALGIATREHIGGLGSARAWVALVYLCVFGSLVAFTAYSWLLRNARAVVATSYAYVNPIVAVLVGAAFYNEPITGTTVVANILIVGAVALALSRKVR